MRRKRFWIFLCAAFIGTFFIYAKSRPITNTGRKQNPPLRTIVIDPGHSASTPGARGKYSTEEQITLDVALKLGKLIEANMKDVRVVYTRKTSAAIGPNLKADLNQRAIIANREKGDLFISIHCNSAGPIRHVTGYKTVMVKKGKKKVATKQAIYATSPNTAEGTETYVWATGKNNAKTESLRESPVIMLDANDENANTVMDMSDPETVILLNTLRNAYFDQSLRLSSFIEDEFSHVGRISRGARQRDEKGIWVLQATAMPSVLVELGFISNPEEEDYLNSESGQQELASCIFKAIKHYKDELGRYGTPQQKDNDDSQPQPSMQPTPVSYRKGATPQKSRTMASAAPARTKVEEEISAHSMPKGGSSRGTPAKNQTVKPTASYAYDVQLLISDKRYGRDDAIFQKIHGMIKHEQITINNKRLHKYIWGSFRSQSEANTALERAKKAGFWNAFLLPPKGNNRLASR
jgi:N-acetylmuramoyl-L-alanine amidase